MDFERAASEACGAWAWIGGLMHRRSPLLLIYAGPSSCVRVRATNNTEWAAGGERSIVLLGGSEQAPRD